MWRDIQRHTNMTRNENDSCIYVYIWTQPRETVWERESKRHLVRNVMKHGEHVTRWRNKDGFITETKEKAEERRAQCRDGKEQHCLLVVWHNMRMKKKKQTKRAELQRDESAHLRNSVACTRNSINRICRNRVPLNKRNKEGCNVLTREVKQHRCRLQDLHNTMTTQTALIV